MKTIFLTFGGSFDAQTDYRYKIRIQEITNEAQRFQLFDFILAYSNEHLMSDDEFVEKHGNFVKQHRRGHGYWIWKSYLTKKILSYMDSDDILVYADAGCTLNINGKNRLLEYIDYVKKNPTGVLCFELSGQHEFVWTKNDVFEKIGLDDDSRSSLQRLATTFVIRKCDQSVNFVDQWYNICCDYHMIDDTQSISKNNVKYSENRHDQSAFSCVSKKLGIPALPDETWFYPNWNSGIMFPIWATRKH